LTDALQDGGHDPIRLLDEGIQKVEGFQLAEPFPLGQLLGRQHRLLRLLGESINSHV